MAFNYSPEGAKAGRSKDRVRLLIADTTFVPLSTGRPPVGIFHDEEILAALSMHGENVFLAAAMLCRVLAVDASKVAVRIGIGRNSAGGLEIDKTMVVKQYITIAKDLEKRAAAADGGLYWLAWTDEGDAVLRTEIDSDLRTRENPLE